ncbi:MAG TPA: DUF5668 domain-containing protein [Bryobacteraceae bacterium]|jgi:hypothetical protein|nr:DUF5668 domain-containing protein [Bryobacteraceae bacterium]
MEQYDNQPKDGSGNFWPKGTAALIPGVVLVGIGALFLLDNLHILHVSTWFAYWPVILVAVGLVKLVDSQHTGGQIAGGVLMAVGGLFLADNLGYIQVDQLWPLILIALGVFMLWNRVRPGHEFPQWARRDWHQRRQEWGQRHQHWGQSDFGTDASSLGGHKLREVNVFTGTRRVITDQDFRGGKVDCVFGGITLDLRGAEIAGGQAVLHISAVYGGAVVLIPAHWDLAIRGGGFFGGYSDQTVHPPRTPGTKRLIAKGGAVFGGVTFKN